MSIDLDDTLALCASRKLWSMFVANGGNINSPVQNEIHVV